MLKYIVTIALIVIHFSSLANDTTHSSPTSVAPYQASYEATWKAGWFPITVDASRSLAQLENGQWQLTFQAYSSVADLHEESQYTIENTIIKPQNYRYKTSGFLSKKRRAQSFDWDKKQVWVPEREEFANYELTLGIQDNLSYQEQIRLDLKAGKTEFSYPVAYKNRLKQYDFKVTKHSQLTTRQGKINTVEVAQIKDNKKESTHIWFAVDYDYLLIKLETKQKNGNSNAITLKEARMKDKTLKGF